VRGGGRRRRRQPRAPAAQAAFGRHRGRQGGRGGGRGRGEVGDDRRGPPPAAAAAASAAAASQPPLVAPRSAILPHPTPPHPTPTHPTPPHPTPTPPTPPHPQFLDEALKQEFRHEEEKADAVGERFNETRAAAEGTEETVILISTRKGNATGEHHHAASDSAGADGADADGAGDVLGAGEADIGRIIDSQDNEYVLSKPNEGGAMGITLDPQLIRDLGTLIACCALAAVASEAAGQPAINGYFIAGSLLGPGGAGWVHEIVQVQSLAQLGVQLLLFTLGLEFEPGKLRPVRDVALWGGLLQIGGMVGLGAAAAAALGVGAAQGAFVGAVLSMSSTSVVAKCLQEARAGRAPHAQIAVGTLILQDCVVGVLFALTPLLASAAAGTAEGAPGLPLLRVAAVAGRLAAALAAAAAVTAVAAFAVLPRVVRWLARFSPEAFLMSALGLCLAGGMATTRLGVSSELGAFLAGLALSATEGRAAAARGVEPLAQLFLALFIASTALTMAPGFLLEHLPILAAAVLVVTAAKAALIAGVVLLFGRPFDTAVAVGVSLAQVGEFGFVLLSLAHAHGLVAQRPYLLLMGTTALSLLLTPPTLQLSARLLPKARAAAGSDADLGDLELAGVSAAAKGLRREGAPLLPPPAPPPLGARSRARG
jgi:Kef-type K+ transport system membrane component KefB